MRCIHIDYNYLSVYNYIVVKTNIYYYKKIMEGGFIMENVLVGIQRSSFEDQKTGEKVKMTDCYIVTQGIELEGLEGNICARHRLMRMEKPELLVGDKVNVVTMPDGKGGMKVVDIQKVL